MRRFGEVLPKRRRGRLAAKGDLYSIIESRRRSKKHYGERTLWRYFWQLCQVPELIIRGGVTARSVKNFLAAIANLQNRERTPCI